MSKQKEQIKALLDEHGITIESVFVPFSRSRNAGEKHPSLNWIVTLKHNGRNILTTDYMAGYAHAPSYNKKESAFRFDPKMYYVKRECEGGKEAKGYNYGKTILPDSVDVVYCLLMDAEVLDYDEFEEWAGTFGYDVDSRKGEAVYSACLKIAIKFNKLGEAVINELREAYQDY